MRFLVKRVETTGVFLFGLLGLITAAELAFGDRSSLDIAIAVAVVAVAICLFASLRSVKESLSASLSAADELRMRLAQQQAVARLGQLALTNISRQELLDEASLTLATELGTDLASIVELLPDGSGFVLRTGFGWPREQLGFQHIPAGLRSHAGYTLVSNGPVIMSDSATETRFEISPHMAAQRVASGVSTTIGSNGGAYGVIAAHTYAQRDFTDSDVTFLESVANVLATALQRQSAEEEAEQTHRVLEAVTEGTTDDVFVKDIDGRFIALNASAAHTVGRPREEVIGRTLHEVLPLEIAETMAATDRLICERGTVETFEEIVNLDGATRVFLTTKGPYRAYDGTLLGTFGVARDITERKTQEQELARSEERFRLAQESAQMGTGDLDVLTGVMTWSDGLRALYGVGPNHPAGFESFVELIHPDDRERVRAAMADSQALGRPDLEIECRIIRPDGDLRWLLVRSASRRADDGTLIRTLGVTVDITERKLADEEQMRGAETLRLALAATGLGAWDWNLDTGEVSMTPETYEIYGVDPATFVPTYPAMSALIHPDDLSVGEAELERVIAAGETHYEYSCRIVQPCGDIRWSTNRGTVVRSADGTPQRLLGVTVDETEHKKAEAERSQLENRLRQAEKLEALGQLAGGVAHDFNNLLVAIRGYGELARDKLHRDETDVAGDVEGVLAAADRAAGLTRQLLAFGRRQVLNPEVLDLNVVARETDAMLQRVIGDDVRLITTLDDEPVVVRADRGQLEQVITNLVVNARDAMPGGGDLTIKVTTAELPGATSRQALLSVTDEGAGIDAQTVLHMFEPFFTTKGEAGTGLGLATVHGIVAQSGGQVALDTALGRGSTFSVYLPLSAEELSSIAAPPAATGDKGTETILLIEDDPTVRSIVSLMLTARGYDILDAADGPAAVVQFEMRDRPIHLVVSDLIMHGLDGRQTVERIRALEPATRVLYMSGYTDDAIIRNGGLTPGTGFIQKPFSGDDLAARVRDLLDGVAAA